MGSPEWVREFGTRLEELFAGYLWEAINRWKKMTPSLSTYRTMRETTIGLYPQFVLHELADGVRLEPEVLNHPALRRLMAATCNAVGLANDLFTYEKEMEQGEVHNVVLSIMGTESLGLDEAVRRAVQLHDDVVRAFLAAEAELPSFGAADERVRRFVAMLRCWMRGHLDWAQLTGRYRPTASTAAAAEA
jgi:hypothetical protein